MNAFGLTDTSAADIAVRLDRLADKIREPDFRTANGKANEVNYWVFDYAPECELAVRSRLWEMVERNQEKKQPYVLKMINLYDVTLDFLERKQFLNKCDKMEDAKGLTKMTGAIRRALRMDEEENVLVRYLKDVVDEKSILFITGIGECHPILRAQDIFTKVLYNLPRSMDNIPVVLFYPGTYNEQELILFNEEKEGNYYRAFRIVR